MWRFPMRSRAVMPIALAMLAVAIFLAAAFLSRSTSETVNVETQIDAMTSSATTPQLRFDDEGRQIFIVGETELRIPASENAISTLASPAGNVVQVTLCWPRDAITGECPGIEDVAFIFLQGGNMLDPTVVDSMAKLRQELPGREGPFETDMDGIWVFHYSDKKNVLDYALIEPSVFNRHTVARCYGGPRCSTWIHVAPGLSARYNFDKQHLAVWPQIDQQIRNYARSFLVGERAIRD